MNKGVLVSDVPGIIDFPDVFLEELLGVPTMRQVEFISDMILRVILIATALY